MAQQPKPPELTIQRTLNQICSPDGQPYQANATGLAWVTQSDPYPATEGNEVTPLLTGRAYFDALAAAIAGADRSVYMLGWQINWDVQLRSGLRLFDALLNAAKQKPALKIYLLPWAGSSAVPTYVADTVAAVKAMNIALGGAPRVFAKGAAPHAAPSKGLAMFFSHHQKQAVIDERLAFVGGIDVAYGRADDATYSLNATGRTGNDSYNGCLPHLKPVDAANYVDCAKLAEPDVMQTDMGTMEDNEPALRARANLWAGKVQFPDGGTEIDATRQPRMPWQDVHLKIEGPAVSDLASNFVLRWNSAVSKPRLPLPAAPAAYAKKGTCQIQLLRSASHKMVDLEAKGVTPEERSRVHNQSGHNHIHHAMVRLIERANHFIYIENQFFVSAFGAERFGDGDQFAAGQTESPAVKTAIGMGVERAATQILPGDFDAPPTNLICAALGAKLRDVIMNCANPSPDGKTSRFHVYLTLPVHSEGMLNNMSVMTQVHYTMQSLVFGEQSLVNRIRRAILARQLLDKGDAGHDRVFEDGNLEYRTVPMDWCWPYLTMLNLRNWAQLGNRYVTEQVYVHTKMMIVDDLYAIVGSANINDRSLSGDRDSEMAVLLVDKHGSAEDIGCVHGPQLTRKFARELRMGVWNKIFGNTGKVRAAGLDDAIKRPAAQGSWEDIRDLAQKNTRLYEAAFNFVPANNKSIWPSITFAGTKRNAGVMPFDNAFWDAPRHAAAASQLSGVKGYITLLPWLWTQGENNNSGYHSALFVNNEAPASHLPVDRVDTGPALRTAQRVPVADGEGKA
jgi:phospholipase D1/2